LINAVEQLEKNFLLIVDDKNDPNYVQYIKLKILRSASGFFSLSEDPSFGGFRG